MKFIYGHQQLSSSPDSQKPLFLSANGLGGYMSLTGVNSVNRCDQGILVGAMGSPNCRETLVHRLQERLETEDCCIFLSTQDFGDDRPSESGWKYLDTFSWDAFARYQSTAQGITVTRCFSAAWEENQAVLSYEISNCSEKPWTLKLRPGFKFAPKEQALSAPQVVSLRENLVCFGEKAVYIHTDGLLTDIPLGWELLKYDEDAKDGRPGFGYCSFCCEIEITVLPGETKPLEVVFSDSEKALPAESVLEQRQRRKEKIESGFQDPIAAQLAAAVDDYIVRRGNEKTIIAGYPLFADWGRDTMIALGGCCLATGRFEDAKQILRTFLKWERRGMVPNLFPEGQQAPLYNTVDAALLLINTVWEYILSSGDWDFGREAYPVMERIIAFYRKGTDHHVSMDEDGLIQAGAGLEQLTWMDVCVDGVLPTPRQGKPVEVNAYWYSALRVMDALGEKLNLDRKDYKALSELVKQSFRAKFYMEDRGYLRDLVSGTRGDEQLRCNQIWAITQPFTMLEPDEERSVVDTVTRYLYTPCGLRTLSPEDPDYHPYYGGAQYDRDMAYHQGTTWVFPMGAYYLGFLKTRGNTEKARKEVREKLDALIPMLWEGCAGQLPEIYDGDFPKEGKGCFAQAWSAAEMLRVFRALDQKEGECYANT